MMQWPMLLCSDRLNSQNEHVKPEEIRSEYERDIDRLIFSNAFRRLSRKTQVHPFADNAHTHNRLTHSLEVGNVGRSLGRRLGERIKDRLPKGVTSYDIGAIVQAASLAHDIGNPPFGHAGEDALSDWFDHEGNAHLKSLSASHKRDIQRFEGNAQGFRIITQIENHLWSGGLRLTFATLGAFLKYPWSSAVIKEGEKEKYSCFLCEEPILKQVADKTGMISKGAHRWCRHPLSYLTEAADDICYATLDLEDAVELKLLSYAEVRDLLLSALSEPIAKEVSKLLVGEDSYRVNFSRLRGPVFTALINSCLDGYEKHYDSIMNGSWDKGALKLIDDGSPQRIVIEKSKKMGEERIYTEQFKTDIEMGCFAALGCILNAFSKAATESAYYIYNQDESTISSISKLVLRQMRGHAPNEKNGPSGKKWTPYSCLRRVLDYVSGMTDDYAWSMASKLQGISSKSRS